VSGGRSALPGVRITLRSMKFCSSRMFPGQAMGDKYIHHCGGNSIDVFVHAYCISRHKVSYQQRNVLRPIPQRRDGYRKNVEAIVEIAAKPFL